MAVNANHLPPGRGQLFCFSWLCLLARTLISLFHSFIDQSSFNHNGEPTIYPRRAKCYHHRPADQCKVSISPVLVKVSIIKFDLCLQASLSPHSFCHPSTKTRTLGQSGLSEAVSRIVIFVCPPKWMIPIEMSHRGGQSRTKLSQSIAYSTSTPPVTSFPLSPRCFPIVSVHCIVDSWANDEGMDHLVWHFTFGLSTLGHLGQRTTHEAPRVLPLLLVHKSQFPVESGGRKRASEHHSFVRWQTVNLSYVPVVIECGQTDKSIDLIDWRCVYRTAGTNQPTIGSGWWAIPVIMCTTMVDTQSVVTNHNNGRAEAPGQTSKPNSATMISALVMI